MLMFDDESETALLPSGTQQLQKRDDATAVRWRLTSCIFLYTIGASMMTQIYPKIILVSYGGDDGEASKYKGWMVAWASVMQLLFVPTISGSSDVVGRRAVICCALVLHAGAVFGLAATASSLVWATVCKLVTSLSTVILPVSQAIMIDLSAEGGQDATHGLGIAFGVFALGSSAGDIVGGSLSEHRRGVACLVSGMLASAALLSLALFGWKETAPPSEEEGCRQWWRWWAEGQQNGEEGGGWGGAGSAAVGSNGSAAGSGRNSEREDSADTAVDGSDANNNGGTNTPVDAVNRVQDGDTQRTRAKPARGETKLFNSFSVLKVFLESRVLLQVACSYFLFVLSLNVFVTGYNYLDYRYGWTPVEISYFFATYNALGALAGGWVIRGIVPNCLSEENGALVGITVQACAMTVTGLCVRGWMVYPALAFGALQNITEPCLQAIIMATFVGTDGQGSLQGAIMSLCIVAEGIAAPLFTQVFARGSSAGFEEAPFLLATVISLLSLAVSWWPLRTFDGIRKDLPADHDAAAAAEERTLMEGDGTQYAAEEGSSVTAGATPDNGTMAIVLPRDELPGRGEWDGDGEKEGVKGG